MDGLLEQQEYLTYGSQQYTAAITVNICFYNIIEGSIKYGITVTVRPAVRILLLSHILLQNQLFMSRAVYWCNLATMETV